MQGVPHAHRQTFSARTSTAIAVWFLEFRCGWCTVNTAEFLSLPAKGQLSALIFTIRMLLKGSLLFSISKACCLFKHKLLALINTVSFYAVNWSDYLFKTIVLNTIRDFCILDWVHLGPIKFWPESHINICPISIYFYFNPILRVSVSLLFLENYS